MDYPNLSNNTKTLCIISGTKYQPLIIAYKREAVLLNERVNSPYTYDAHGNITIMPHLPKMQWDYADRLKLAETGNGNVAYYNYDHSGNRSRKVVIKGNIREERYYLNGYEVYRKTINGTPDTERTTLHVMDDTKTVALLETDTLQNTVTVRYQYDNHLGSACLELDENADIISYEEYHPFGTTSYRSERSDTEVSQKRYKYVGKERDEETGLYYYGARYYAAWLCRFVSVDPLQFEYPHYTPYQYAGNKPISYIDLDGLEEAKFEEYQAMFGGYIPGTGSYNMAAIGYSLDCITDANWWYELFGFKDMIEGAKDYSQNEANYKSDNSTLPLDKIPQDVQNVNYTMNKWNSIAQTTQGVTTFYSSTFNTLTLLQGGAELYLTARVAVTTTLVKNAIPFKNASMLSSEFSFAENAAFEAQNMTVNVAIKAEMNVAAKGGSDIAFGLGDDLFKFAETKGFQTYRNFSTGFQQDKIFSAIENSSNNLHFNLTGFSKYQFSKFNPNGIINHGNITNWELHTILNNPNAIQRTTFYRFSNNSYNVVSNPFK